MEKVYIPNLLKSFNKTQVIDINEHLFELETLTPVRGEVKVAHAGTYLNVQGRGEAIVTLTCHRCLQNYNHRLVAEPKELIWLEETASPSSLPLEQEVSLEDLVETLPVDGYFDPYRWLYEQLCLALPQQQLCEAACSGINAVSPGEEVPASSMDQRWAALMDLKQQLSDEPSS